MIFTEGKISVSTHAHRKYISSSSLARFINIGTTDEVFEFSNKNIPFATRCGYINYVGVSVLIIWI